MCARGQRAGRGPDSGAPAPSSAGKTDELGDPANTFEDIINYNNFYEFSTDKQAVAGLSKDFKAEPWTVEVGGLVNNPKTYGIEDLLKMFPQEERIYRLRCVEAWSMVIPWNGFPLASLLKEVEPTSDASMSALSLSTGPMKCPVKKAHSILAVSRRPAPGRSHERSGHPCHRFIR